MGIYPGPLTIQTIYVSLILNLDTDMLSSQLKFEHGNLFETERPTDNNPPKFSHCHQISSIRRDVPHHIQP